MAGSGTQCERTASSWAHSTASFSSLEDRNSVNSPSARRSRSSSDSPWRYLQQEMRSGLEDTLSQ